ncbi:hypothetical protein PAPHI01_0020 [Pancytospora philotis]|nr:hypothetical protein PAPHI01_0020 [Pancytospora philotis]
MDYDALKQLATDKFAPHPRARWCVFAAMALIYLARIYRSGDHHLLTYVVGVYLFHAFILFATPKNDEIPDPFDEEVDLEAEDAYQPINTANNLRPFVRNMPEFTFWWYSLFTLVVSFLLTFTQFTNIPVCTPILVVYFIFMVCTTLVRLLKHSKKYNYNILFQRKINLDE